MTNVLAALRDQSPRKPATTAVKINSHWNLLKTLINTDEDESDKTVKKVEDNPPKVISHGVHHVGQIDVRKNNVKALKFVAYNLESSNYVTICDEGKLTIFFPSGKSREIKSNDRYKGIIFANKTKQWISWDNNDQLKAQEGE